MSEMGTPESRRQALNQADKRARIDEDLVLIQEILGGSISHWHAFVDRFSGLIYSVIRRQLFAEDEDDIRTVFADVLAALYHGKIGEFEGKAELSTWLIVVSRGKAFDFLRKRDGRRKMPLGYDDLSPSEQEVFQLHYVNGLSFEVVIQSLESAARFTSAEDIAHAILKIEATIDSHYLRRLEYEAKAPALGVSSGRLLDFIQRVQLRYESEDKDRPDHALDRKEILEMSARIRDLLSEFSDEEQEVMRLRFDEGWTAKQIASELDLPSQRRVYTVIDGVIRSIRNMLHLK